MHERDRRDGGIAVVGAGIAGLAAASALARAGFRVRVVEKSRGLGGRAATRRRGGPAFDHGAPCFAAHEPSFATEAGRWIAAGIAARWDEAPGGPALVGLPGISALAGPLAEGLEIALETRVTGLSGSPGAWRLETEAGPLPGRNAAVVLAIPAPQAAALLGARAAAFPALGSVAMEPCRTVMAAFAEPVSPEPWLTGDGAPLALAIRESAKPGRAALPEPWVLHAGAEWSAARLDTDPDTAGAALLAGFAARLGRTLPEPVALMVHGWRYARAARPLGQPCLWEASLGLGLAGDWCLGREIGDAWASGHALAARIAAG